jgi:hypothetical protein
MLYVVELRGEREELSTIMGRIREWLDSQRFEPDAFRCTTDDVTVAEPPPLSEVAQELLGHVIFFEHDIGQENTPAASSDIETDRDAIVAVEPLAHVA